MVICLLDSSWANSVNTVQEENPPPNGYLSKLYCEVKPNLKGNIATYIPELAKIDPKLFGISVCTIDGQKYSVGDSDFGFCVQSCSKPISYLIAIQENGFDKVHDCMGCEPSGVEFNNAIL